jgi:hypothetical protein
LEAASASPRGGGTADGGTAGRGAAGPASAL